MIFYFVVGKPKSLGKKKMKMDPLMNQIFRVSLRERKISYKEIIFFWNKTKKVILTMYPKAKHLKLHKQTNKKFIVILDENKKEKKNDLAETNQS